VGAASAQAQGKEVDVERANTALGIYIVLTLLWLSGYLIGSEFNWWRTLAVGVVDLLIGVGVWVVGALWHFAHQYKIVRREE
jgi:hypothetical protein